jgi:hypothetical protein
MKSFPISALAASMVALALPALPAHAAEFPSPAAVSFAPEGSAASPFVPVVAYDDDWDDDRRDRRRWRGRDRGWDDDRRWRGRDNDYWRDDRGRWRCRRNDGTTGLLVGAGVGALVGRTIDRRGDRTLGTVIGAVGGGLLGREIERGGRGDVRCR